MSYPVQTPVPGAAPRRPVTVRLAAALLTLMGLVGLGYAIATLVVAPVVVDRFRDAANGADNTEIEGYVTVVWISAALGAVLAVILFALFIVLALGLRRGSQAFRVGTWVVCGLGVLFGCGSTVAVVAQRSGEGDPGTLGVALSGAYPDPWIGLNLSLAIAQMIGYVVVAALLVISPGAFFRRGNPAEQPGRPGAYVTLPIYGSANAYPGGQWTGAQPGPYPPAAAPQPPAGIVQPPAGTVQPPAGTVQPPAGAPRPGPDDDYWARPSS